MAINGFITCNDSVNGNFRVPGTSRYLRVRRDIAPLLIGFAQEFHEKVEPITNSPMDDWGYNCRSVRGRNAVSFHAGGIAIDLNATKHPLGRRNTFNARQRATIRVLCQKYGLRPGMNFNRADDMHFEVILPRAEALELARRLQEKPATPVMVSAFVPRLAKVKFGAHTSDVVLLQKRLNRLGFSPGLTDGVYGPATRAAVRAFQRSQGWAGRDADGIVGPVTLERLFR
jgi:hypothetical protein